MGAPAPLPRRAGPSLIYSRTVFGADVTHPSPGSMAPSISSLVGSMDSKCTLYGTAIRVQSCASLSSALRPASRTDFSVFTARIEIIAHLDEMMTQLIKQFEAKLKTRPQRLIVFRDGVSEGQFSSTLATGEDLHSRRSSRGP
mgnify:CR=1 FL=1